MLGDTKAEEIVKHLNYDFQKLNSRPLSVLTIEVEAGQIRTIRIIANTEKLTHV